MSTSTEQEIENITLLIDMGLSPELARKYLQKSKNNVERAADLYFSTSGALTEDVGPGNWDASAHAASEPQVIGDVQTPPGLMEDADLQRAVKASLSPGNWGDSSLPSPMALDGNQLSQPAGIGTPETISIELGSEHWPIPITPPERRDIELDQAIANSLATASESFPASHKDPPNPHDRKKGCKPLGLRPISDCHFITPFLQALFHSPEFRSAIYGFAPLASSWGEPGIDKTRSPIMPDFDQLMTAFDKASAEPTDQPIELSTASAGIIFVNELQRAFAALQLSNQAYVDATPLFKSWGIPNIVATRGWANIVQNLMDSFCKRISATSICSTLGADLARLFNIRMIKAKRIHAGFGVPLETDVIHTPGSFIPLEISRLLNSVHDALTQKMLRPTNEVCRFTVLPRLLLFNLIRGKDYVDPNLEFVRGNLPQGTLFRIEKELHMDRYMDNNRRLVEEILPELHRLETEKSQLLDKSRKISKCGDALAADVLRGTASLLENFASSSPEAYDYCMAAKRKVDELRGKLDQRIQEIESGVEDVLRKYTGAFDLPELQSGSYRYRLRSVQVHDGLKGPNHQWCFTRIPRSELTPEFIKVAVSSGKIADGTDSSEDVWVKFSDTLVEPVAEDQVFEDASGYNIGAGVYGLLYEKMDRQTPEVPFVDVPESLKEYIAAENSVFETELAVYVPQIADRGSGSGWDFPPGTEARNENVWTPEDVIPSPSLPPSTVTGVDETMEVFPETPSIPPSSVTGLEERIEVFLEAVKRIRSWDYRITDRFEIFLARMDEPRTLELLFSEFVSSEELTGEALQTLHKFHLAPHYAHHQKLIKFVHAHSIYQVISLCITDALVHMTNTNFAQALESFARSMYIERRWVQGDLARDTNLLLLTYAKFDTYEPANVISPLMVGVGNNNVLNSGDADHGGMRKRVKQGETTDMEDVRFDMKDTFAVGIEGLRREDHVLRYVRICCTKLLSGTEQGLSNAIAVCRSVRFLFSDNRPAFQQFCERWSCVLGSPTFAEEPQKVELEKIIEGKDASELFIEDSWSEVFDRTEDEIPIWKRYRDVTKKVYEMFLDGC